MQQTVLGVLGIGLLWVAASCGGTDRIFDESGTGGQAGAATGGAAGSTSTASGGKTGTSSGGSAGASAGGTAGASTGGSSGASIGGSSGGGTGGTGTGGQGGAAGSMDSGPETGPTADTGLPDTTPKPDSSAVDSSVDAGTKADADAASVIDSSTPVDVAPDRPKSCVGPPLCSRGMSQPSCVGIRGCSWSQCTFRTPGTGVACGSEGQDRASNCPPGCHLSAPGGNCVGASGDFYGSPDDCGATSRQTQNACLGVGSVWQMCSWLPAVTCVGRPTRQDCTGITDAIICAQEGCLWE